MMNLRPQITLRHAAAVMLAAVSMTSSAFALPEGFKIAGGFTEEGDALVATSGAESRLVTTQPLSPGWYAFTAEYRTEGFDPLGQFAVDIKTADWKTSLSAYEWNSAVGDGSPLVVYFRVETAGNVQIRFGNWKQADDNAKLVLRNPAVKPFRFADMVDSNWLTDGSFDAGQVGYIPPDWFWKYASGDISQESLIANTSYRRGKHVLRMVGGGEKGRVLQSRAFPLPPNGEIEFSVWARSSEGGTLKLHIVRDGWGSRAEKSHTPVEAWKKYSVSWPVDAGDRHWFFARIDKDQAPTGVEIADARITWKPASPVADAEVQVDPHEQALQRGWQGTPGANLLYNPDFELGGTGFYYDFSWPKKYGHYESIRRAQPIEFLDGKGVDGGTCARVRGASLRAYCFPVTVGQTYTISADLRAPDGKDTADCMVLSFDSEWRAALWKKATDIPGDRWKRYSWTITWSKPNTQKRGYVRFDSSDVLVDRIQVVEGTEKDYQAPPVMLGLIYDRWPYFVRGKHAAAATIKVVPGEKREGMAEIKVVARDARGRSAWTKTLTAPLNETTLVPVELPTESLGTFHVDLTATVDGETAGIGISRYAIIDPPALQTTSPGKPGLAGICQETFNFPVWLCEDHARIQTDIGIRLNRFFASIPPDLPMPIPADFTADLLAKCKPFRQAGIDFMPCVELIPEWVAKANADLDMPTPKELDTFGEYLHAYVDALKSEVRYWEIFNEPNLWRVSSGPDKGKRTMYPEKYLEFQKVAYKTIKEIDPNLQVVCNALNNLQWDWINDWMQRGAGNYMDAFSFHPYGVTNFYDEGVKLRHTMDGYKFSGPCVNSEKYYGANIFYDRAGYEETRRGYYLPHDGELATAGRSIQHFVTHAAVGMPVCFFNPAGTISRRGPAGELFVYDFFSAYSAAIRFMVNAGSGKAIELGPSIDAIVFANDPAGPLAVLWSPRLNVDARMKLTGNIQAYDIMGNPYSADDADRGVRIATDPVYVRFPAGTSFDEIIQAMTQAEVIGLGDPFKVDLAITGGRQVSAFVTSLRNQPLDGKVTLSRLPDGWKVSDASRTFSNLKPGQTVRVDFDFETITIDNMGSYKLSAVAECGDEFARTDATLRPMFADRLDGITVDGDISDWSGATWVELGDAQTSKAFSETLTRRGPEDLSARIAVGWTDAAVAVAVVVTDDQHQPAEAAGLGWQGDSLQVYFDPKNDAATDKPNTADDVVYTISLINGQPHAWLDKGAEGNFKGKANKTDGLEDGDVKLAVKRSGTQTVYELVFPQAQCIPGLTLAEDANMGFSLLINDNDGKGRKTGLTLAPKGSEPYGHPQDYVDMIVRP